MLDDKIQNPSKFLFQFTLGGKCYGSKKWRWSIDSVDDLKSSDFVQGYSHFPNFEMLDARIASALKIRSSRIPTSRKRSVWRNRRLKKRIGFFPEDRSLT